MRRKATKKNLTYSLDNHRLLKLIENVRNLKTEGLTIDTIYEIVLSGHHVFKAGMGLPEEWVKNAIMEGLKEEK